MSISPCNEVGSPLAPMPAWMSVVYFRHFAFAAMLMCNWHLTSVAMAQSLVIQPTSAVQHTLVPTGSRVRFLTAGADDKPQIGTVTAAMGDVVTIRAESGGQLHTYTSSQLTRLDVSGGRHAHPVRGLVIGMFVGAATFAAVGAAAESSPRKSLFPGPNGAEVGALGGAIAGAPVGAVVGVVTGAAIHTERWDPVSLGQSRVGIAIMPSPRDRGIALRLALGF